MTTPRFLEKNAVLCYNDRIVRIFYTILFNEVAKLEKKNTNNLNRPAWFRFVKGFLKIFVRKPKFKFTGRAFSANEEPFIILSNHVGASAPIMYELYLDVPFRYWGAHEMTLGLKSAYRYLSTIYLHQKKHYPKVLAKIVAFIICPFVNLFYKGIDLIPTYTDPRFRKTIRESAADMENGKNLVIFPENSSDGYHDVLSSFLAGFAFFSKVLLKKGRDVLIYCAYYRKKDRTVIVSDPVRFSKLCGGDVDNVDIRRIAKELCDKTNALADK